MTQENSPGGQPTSPVAPAAESSANTIKPTNALDTGVHTDTAAEAVRVNSLENKGSFKRFFSKEGRQINKEARENKKAEKKEQKVIITANDEYTKAEVAAIGAKGKYETMCRKRDALKSEVEKFESTLKEAQVQGMSFGKSSAKFVEKRAQVQEKLLKLSREADVAEAEMRRLETARVANGNTLREKAAAVASRIESKIAPLERRKGDINARLEEINTLVEARKPQIQKFEEQIGICTTLANDSSELRDVYIELLDTVKEEFDEFKNDFAYAEKERNELTATLGDIQHKVDLLLVPANDYARRSQTPTEGVEMPPMNVEKANKERILNMVRGESTGVEIKNDKPVDLDKAIDGWNKYIATNESLMLTKPYIVKIKTLSKGQQLTVGRIGNIIDSFFRNKNITATEQIDSFKRLLSSDYFK